VQFKKGKTQNPREQKQFWKQYWREKKEEQSKKKAPQSSYFASGMTRKTPWTPSNGYVLDDIKHISKPRFCPGMAQVEADAKEEEEELVVTNFD
jgi:hypothetical protein